uniref:Uncharacterized protein n=1 Tax=Trichogramma kaykai TaxID=54128 RepID=A0ABD2WGX8_9HYME
MCKFIVLIDQINHQLESIDDQISHHLRDRVIKVYYYRNYTMSAYRCSYENEIDRLDWIVRASPRANTSRIYIISTIPSKSITVPVKRDKKNLS